MSPSTPSFSLVGGEVGGRVFVVVCESVVVIALTRLLVLDRQSVIADSVATVSALVLVLVHVLEDFLAEAHPFLLVTLVIVLIYYLTGDITPVG